MPHAITIPRLGWSMEEGVLSQWLKQPGEQVRAGEMLFTLEGEKAAQEIESLDTGVLWIPPDAPTPGTTVLVGQVIGYLLREGEAAPTSVGTPSPGTKPATPSGTAPLPRPAGPAARRLARQLGINLESIPTPDPTGRVVTDDLHRIHKLPISRGKLTVPHASPRARRRARELGIDWTTLTGSGRDGRIRERDIVSRPPSTIVIPAESAPVSPGQYHPATKRRATIAQRMFAGVTQAAPVTITTKVDATPLIDYRNALKQAKESTPSYQVILIQIVSQTLRSHPTMNACWHRNGIHIYDDIHIAIAVDCDAGLLAPVLRQVDRLSLEQIAAESRKLIDDARTGRIGPQALEGGTFTVTNLGIFGIDSFTPILNLPQAGILGIGRIVEEPVFRDGQIVPGSTLSLSLTFDHRVIDGAPAARWLASVCEQIRQLKLDC